MLVTIAMPLALIALIVYLLATRGDQIGTALRRLGVGDVVLVTLLALLTLLARTEAVVACLTATGDRPSRRDVHAANSLTMLAANINHYLSSVVRAALVRRIDPGRAPTIPQMILVDTSTTLIEGLLVLLLIIMSAGTLKLDWWLPPVALIAGICAVVVVMALHRRFRAHPVLRGLDVLAHSRQRAVVTALMTLVIICQILRTLIVLRGVGLDASLLQAVATFVAAGVLSTLFLGPGAGTAGAPLLVFGHAGLAAAAAAGLVLSVTTLLAGMAYSFVGGPVLLWRVRRPTA